MTDKTQEKATSSSIFRKRKGTDSSTISASQGSTAETGLSEKHHSEQADSKEGGKHLFSSMFERMKNSSFFSGVPKKTNQPEPVNSEALKKIYPNVDIIESDSGLVAKLPPSIRKEWSGASKLPNWGQKTVSTKSSAEEMLLSNDKTEHTSVPSTTTSTPGTTTPQENQIDPFSLIKPEKHGILKDILTTPVDIAKLSTTRDVNSSGISLENPVHKQASSSQLSTHTSRTVVKTESELSMDERIKKLTGVIFQLSTHDDPKAKALRNKMRAEHPDFIPEQYKTED